METLLHAWTALCCLITLVWARRHLDVSRARHDTSALHPEMYDAPPDPAPSVSVIIAAKDEESVIERCVRTMLDQDYPNYTLTLVNDRSQDRTGPILDNLQREAPDKLNIHHVTELPHGWFGKCNAVRIGTNASSGSYLLFSDADCEQTSNRTISTAVRFAVENDIEFLSVMPTMKAGCLWDALLQPVCTAVLVIWHPLERVNDPNRPETYANGAFMLIRRDAYERIGGHVSVRDALCEDMQLARNAKAAGVKLHAIQNRDLYSTRMYTNLSAAWRGWSRIFQGSLQRARKLMLAALVLSVFSLLPTISTAVAAVAIATPATEHSPAWKWLSLTAIAALLVQHSVLLRFYKLLGARTWQAFLYVPAAVVCLAIVINAAFKSMGWGETTWRGTTYDSRSFAEDLASANCTDQGSQQNRVARSCAAQRSKAVKDADNVD